jgi:hypothetical protein
MHTYNFFFQPGLKIAWVKAYTLPQARAIFAQEHRQYAGFIGELYIEME